MERDLFTSQSITSVEVDRPANAVLSASYSTTTFDLMPLSTRLAAAIQAVSLYTLLGIMGLASAQTSSEDRFIGVLATGNQTQFTKLVSSTLDTPGILVEVNDYGENRIRGCEVLDNETVDTLFCVSIEGEFNRIDIETGSQTLVGTLASRAGEGWEGLAYDEQNDVLYGLATECFGAGQTSLYVIDPVQATSTLIGSDNLLTCGVAIAADEAGQLYAYCVQTNRLVKIDPTTGEQTLIGELDFNANFSQGMDISPIDGTCYLFAFNDDTNRAELRTCDLTDATTTLVGPLGNVEPGGLFTLSTGVVVPQFVLAGEDGAVTTPAFDLRPVYPNPSRGDVQVEVVVSEPGPVRIVLHDVLGRAVRTVFDGPASTGQRVTAVLSTEGLAPGVYVLQASGDGSSVARRLTVVR